MYLPGWLLYNATPCAPRTACSPSVMATGRLAPPPAALQVDPAVEYRDFLADSFDPNQFAHAIVNNTEPVASTSTATEGAEVSLKANGATVGGFMKGFAAAGHEGGDVSAALARLNFGVEDLTRQLKSEITKHHSSLLLQAASLGSLEGDLAEVRRGLVEVEGGVSRLRRKITAPHSTLASSLTLLTRLRRASSLARRASRFTVLARRLESQMADIDGPEGLGSSPATPNGVTQKSARERRERAMAEAALTLAELESLLTNSDATAAEDDPEALLPIRSLRAVEANVPSVELSRQRVVEEMESMVHRGLNDLDNALLASSLQTAHNLSVLPNLVEGMMLDLTDSATRKIKTCFDMVSLAREINGKDNAPSTATSFVYKSRARNEPTTVTMPQWTAAMWARLEGLIGDLGNICIKVYSLEKVLKLKKDNMTQATFLDEALTLLDNKPSLMFWTTLSNSLEVQAKETARSSTFIQTTLSTGYPRLLRLFQEFFSKIAVHTDTIYSQVQQSPETVLVLRSIQPFEKLYLTRSTNRLSETVVSSFSITSSLSASFTSRPPTVPTANEGLAAARAIVNELDAARFDPLLVQAVAKGAARAVESYTARAASAIQHDHGATSMLGPLATPSQHSNADLASSLYHLWAPLHRAMSDHTENVRTILKPAVESVHSTYMSISNPLIMAIRREFSSIITRLHRTDYTKKDPSPMGNMGGGSSSYMADLTDKLSFVREELLGAFKVGELGKDWALDLAKFTVQTFILHASIVRCPSEAGKLKLTSDVTALEFAISQYLSSHSLALSNMGDQFKALRAFRPLLFLDTSQLATSSSTIDVPTLILLHHILTRSTLPLPHQSHGWTEAEYVRWLNEHGEQDRLGMIERTVAQWEKDGAAGENQEAVETVRAVLKQRVGPPSGASK